MVMIILWSSVPGANESSAGLFRNHESVPLEHGYFACLTVMKPLNIALVGILLSCCHADIYMHNPRGTNNRLNERSAQRKNANRLFDSQVHIVSHSSSIFFNILTHSLYLSAH